MMARDIPPMPETPFDEYAADKLDQHDETLDNHGETLDNHGEMLDNHGETLDNHGEQIDKNREDIDTIFGVLSNRNLPDQQKNFMKRKQKDWQK